MDDRCGAVGKLRDPEPEKVAVGVVVAGLLDSVEPVHAPAFWTRRDRKAHHLSERAIVIRSKDSCSPVAASK